MRRLLTLAFLALAAPAYAADTLTITITSDGNYAGTLSKTWTFSQADMSTFQAFLLSQYPTSCSPQPCVPPANTVPQAALAWANMLKGGIVSSVQAWQQSTAQAAAATAVNPIAPN